MICSLAAFRFGKGGRQDTFRGAREVKSFPGIVIIVYIILYTHASGHNILLSMCAAQEPQMRDETSIPENAFRSSCDKI